MEINMKKNESMTASEICKKLFYGTGEINYYMLSKAIDDSNKITHTDELVR